MMLLIHFRYPMMGAEVLLGRTVSVDYHNVGSIMLLLSMVMSLVSGAEYMWKFFSAAWRTPRQPA
jgi:hypothetical protein